MEVNNIAAIATTNNVTIFNSVGIKTYIKEDLNEIDKLIYELSKNGCKIVYISEELYLKIPNTLSKYANVPYPIIIPLPIDNKSSGVGDEKIRKSVEKAIGINIF